MGALARPGPQFGSKGPPPPDSLPSAVKSSFSTWFWAFLKQELAPYPGRTMIVLRMVIAATITMILIMTFRLPGAAIAAFYTLLLSRDSPSTTLKSAATVLLSYTLGVSYTLLGVLLFVNYPLTHFVWVIVSIFLCFFAIKVTTNYIAAAAFAFIITIAVPLWDGTGPTDLLLVATLWAAGSVTVGLFTTVLTEYAFALFETRDELIRALTQRLDLVSGLLLEYSTGNVSDETRKKVAQLAMVGVSRLRRLAATSPTNNSDATRRSSTISLVGRLVDLSATMLALDNPPGSDECLRLEKIATYVATLSQLLQGHDHQSKVIPALPTSPIGSPLLTELEQTTQQLAFSLSPLSQETQTTADQTTPALPLTFLPDAFTNREHLTFALRGCLAASLCYVIYNAVAYRTLSTSLATCVITALSSVGSSRQKQLLRLTGAAFGGLVFGIGSQIFILPNLDTIVGFTVLFVVVTWISAWIATSSPRLSYFGLQVALAFYLINLQEFYPQTNLTIARDRVLGIALGLIAMWLIFDTLGSRPAARIMREIFAINLHLLAELAQPWKDNNPADLKHIRSLRDQISMNFASVNSQADAILFEVGPSRQRDLALRERLLNWQPQLRSLFLIQVGLLQYRTQISPEDLPDAVSHTTRSFDRTVSIAMEQLSQAFSGNERPEDRPDLQAALKELERSVEQELQPLSPRAKAILSLSANLTRILQDLGSEISEQF